MAEGGGPAVLRAATDEHPPTAGHRLAGEFRGEAVLPMPGSPVTAANVGSPVSARATPPPGAPAGGRARPAARTERHPGTTAGRAVAAAISTVRTSTTSAPGGGAQARDGSCRSTAVCSERVGAGLQPELLVEHRADRRQRLERVGLPARPRQSQRSQPPQPLPQWVARGE